MFGFSKKVLILTSLPLLLIIVAGFIYIFSPIPVKSKRIGVLFYQNNPTTLKFLNGLKASLAKQGYYQGKNLNLIVENFQDTSPDNTLAILKKIAKKRVHLLITTGKDLTVTAAHTITDKPIIYSLVSRPITEETIKTVITNEKSISGVSYFTPYDRTLELSKRVIPHLHKLTLILPFDSAWPDYIRLREAARKVGVNLSLVETPLSGIKETILSLSGHTDAIYLPYDIQLILRANLLKKSLLQANLPAISNNLEYQSSCILTYYAEPETIGEIAGRMAVKIFHGAKIKYMPVELSSYYELTINLALLKSLHMTISEDVLSYANQVIQ
jgi:putative ABC transport system substrate-binding protein